MIPKGGLQNIQERTVDGGQPRMPLLFGLIALKLGDGHMTAQHVVLPLLMYVSCFIIHCQPRVIIDSSEGKRKT